MKLAKGYLRLLEEAEKEIDAVDVSEAKQLLGDDGVVFVDLREIQELHRDGMIPGAFHAPRGLLEFWVDPDSPYHKTIFASGKDFVLYCSKGWRSALATRDMIVMGLPNVRHLEGGFAAWKESGCDIHDKAKTP